MCNDRAMPDEQDLIGSAEACRLLAIHASTLTRWVADGEVAAAHQLPGKNGARLFDRAEIERRAAERSTAGAA